MRKLLIHNQLLIVNYLFINNLRCCSGKDEEDFRPLFDNFVQDLLTTLSVPEWPASEVLLTLMGVLLVSLPLSIVYFYLLSLPLSPLSP